MLFETASWLSENFKQGCIKCAPFLSRQMMEPYPRRPIQIIKSETLISHSAREKNMAYKILKQAVDNPDQQNFVAFVGREHLTNVTR